MLKPRKKYSLMNKPNTNAGIAIIAILRYASTKNNGSNRIKNNMDSFIQKKYFGPYNPYFISSLAIFLKYIPINTPKNEMMNIIYSNICKKE